MNSLWGIIVSNYQKVFHGMIKIKGIKISNALCPLNLQYQLEKRNETIIYELQKPTKNIFMIDISENKYEGLRFENIFTRHRYIGPEGKALHLRSHQPRHLLNTIGQRNGMSDLDLAKWSGRSLVTQNPV
ncbi:hypothetical protein [Enterobacter cloacae complex sp. 301C7]|uniref:hypothetical protein n=1 Tax=Enterobacter cloacae complex sp. 301C7 TaxID=3395848 RepID=UPI003CEAACEE